MRLLLAVSAVAALAGCTTVNTARIPKGSQPGELFVTTGDLKEPYTSLGIIQATRRAPIFLGWIDAGGTDLDDALADLIPEARNMGGDGIINLRFEQIQYPPLGRALMVLFFFVPLPGEVNVTGEVVRLGAPGYGRPPPGAPAGQRRY